MMKTYSIRGIAMDMDGVIIDSNTEIEKFWRAWAAKENIAFTNETMAKHILGRTGADTLAEMFALSNNETKENIQEDAIIFDINMQPPLIKNVDIFLQKTSVYIHNITLVTSSHKRRAMQMLALHNIEQYFTNYVTGDEVKHGKPHPEAFAKAAAKMQFQPYDCLAFEDSNSGILSAAEAGMFVIAVTNNTIQHEKIIARITDFSELIVTENCIESKDKMIKIELNF